MKQIYRLTIETKTDEENLSKEIELALCDADVFGFKENINLIRVDLDAIIK